MDNPQTSYQKLLKERANVQQAITYISSSPQFYKMLFSTITSHNSMSCTNASTELRGDTDISNLILCLHKYQEYFDGVLLNMLKAILDCDTLRDEHAKALTLTIYTLILAAQRKFTLLEAALARLEKGDCLTSLSSKASLLQLCKGINFYTKALLVEPSQRTDNLKKSKRHIDQFCNEEGGRENVKKYFHQQIKLAKPRPSK